MLIHAVRIPSWAIAVVLLCHCARPDQFDTAARAKTKVDRAKSVYVEIPTERPDAFADRDVPVVTVKLVKAGSRSVAVTHVYGYPIYGGAPQGLKRFRHDNWSGYEREEKTDADGVVHVTEAFPVTGCSFEGIAETKLRYVPLYMLCKLPPPKKLGGRKRPIVGSITTRSPPKDIPLEESLEKAFLGDWHITTPGLSDGNGTGYFNTDYGQLGFGFEKGRLTSVTFLFDPPAKAWRSAELWAAP